MMFPPPEPDGRTAASIPETIAWLQSLQAGEWHWVRNSRCKYVELRIDTRRGVYAIVDRDNKPLTIDELTQQYRADA